MSVFFGKASCYRRLLCKPNPVFSVPVSGPNRPSWRFWRGQACGYCSLPPPRQRVCPRALRASLGRHCRRRYSISASVSPHAESTCRPLCPVLRGSTSSPKVLSQGESPVLGNFPESGIQCAAGLLLKSLSPFQGFRMGGDTFRGLAPTAIVCRPLCGLRSPREGKDSAA